jgi:uncharacterized protein (TIGR02246 family)
MMRTSRAAVAGAFLLLCSPVTSRAEADPPRSLVAGFVRAWNAHDAKALGALFAEDADYVTARGNWMKGRAWIEGQMEKALAGRLKGTTMVETNTTVRLVRPDLAVMHFEWEVSGETGPDGKTLITRHGIMQIVAVSRSGAWKILSAQDTATPPPV